MSSMTEQFSAATKSQLEAQFHILNTLASTAVDSAEKLIALNIDTTKASMEKSSAAAKQWLTLKNPKEFFSLPTAQPGGFDALLAYGRELYSIAASAQSELVKSAQSTFQQVTELAATKATVATVSATPPVATEVAVVPKVVKAKPAAAPIPEQAEFIEVKAPAKAAPRLKK